MGWTRQQRHVGCRERGDRSAAEAARRGDEARGDVAAEERRGADIRVGRSRGIDDQRAAKAIVLQREARALVCTGEIERDRVAAAVADRERTRGVRAAVAFADGGESYVNEIDPLAGVGAEAEDGAA